MTGDGGKHCPVRGRGAPAQQDRGEKRAGKEAGYLRRRKISLQREHGAKKGVSYLSSRPH